MNFLKLTKERYSLRNYKNQIIEEEKMMVILEAARIAPTACNRQPQRIKVITSSEELEKVDQCTPCRFGAPVVLLVCYDKNLCWVRSFDKANSGEVDASIVTTHLMLAAQEQGLGSCWVMHFDPAKVTELFHLPENIVPLALLPMGYADDNAKPAEAHFKKVSLNEILLNDEWVSHTTK